MVEARISLLRLNDWSNDGFTPGYLLEAKISLQNQDEFNRVKFLEKRCNYFWLNAGSKDTFLLRVEC